MTPLERRIASLSRQFAADFLTMLRSVPLEELHSVSSRDHVVAQPEEASKKIRDVVRRHIREVIASVHGNKTAAARILGIDRRTLNRMSVRGEL